MFDKDKDPFEDLREGLDIMLDEAERFAIKAMHENNNIWYKNLSHRNKVTRQAYPYGMHGKWSKE
jgi:hypothetical protein